jgi:hypothetical protein
MRHPALREDPPVVVDIGAAGSPPREWKLLAPHAVCVAFDADARDFRVSTSREGGWRELHRVNRLVAAQDSASVRFHLTHSPHCSSVLRPRSDSLSAWAFHEQFRVTAEVELPASGIAAALAAVGVHRVDWYKSDTQGTDLRILEALPRECVTRILALDLEPGIIDAYEGEDKLHAVMARMDELPFWIAEMRVKGSQRIASEDLQALPWTHRRGIARVIRESPGWCEISYLNDFSTLADDLRAHLLGWVFASIRSRHGFAMRIAREGMHRFGDPIFDELLAYTRRRVVVLGWLRMAAFAPRLIARGTARLVRRSGIGVS